MARFPGGLQSRFEDLNGRFWRCYGELAKGIGKGDDAVSYTQLADSRSKPDVDYPWFDAEHTSGSDYSGSLAERTNFEVLRDESIRLAEELGSDDWFQVLYGGHRSYGILFHVIRTPDEIVEMLARLGEYPLLDDDALSHAEAEAEGEAWENWARSDYKRELEKAYGGDADEVSDDALFEHFRKWQEKANVYWANEQGDSMYIDLERIVKTAVDRGGEPPEGFVVEGGVSPEERARLARLANAAARAARRGGAPLLSADSDRATLIAWLVWNDPNGIYSDKDLRAEGEEPMTLNAAWEQLALAELSED